MKYDPFKAKRRKNEWTNLLHLVGRQLAPDAAVVGGVAPHQVVPSLVREKKINFVQLEKIPFKLCNPPEIQREGKEAAKKMSNLKCLSR